MHAFLRGFNMFPGTIQVYNLSPCRVDHTSAKARPIKTFVPSSITTCKCPGSLHSSPRFEHCPSSRPRTVVRGSPDASIQGIAVLYLQANIVLGGTSETACTLLSLDCPSKLHILRSYNNNNNNNNNDKQISAYLLHIFHRTVQSKCSKRSKLTSKL